MSDRIYQILLVEDSQADVRLFKEVTRSWKARHCLYVVDDGEEALDLLHNRGNYDGAPKPDLIFLDLNLPKIDGLETLRSIRQDQDRAIRPIPVIVLTSSSAPGDIANAYQLGANAYVTKTSDLDKYLRMMAKMESFWF